MLGEEIRVFFDEHANDSKVRHRTENALIRGGIETMKQLAKTSDHDIHRVRNLGVKSSELAIAMRDKYAGEDNNHMEEKK